MKKADYGDGHVFQRGKRGTFYVRYSINGVAYTERAVNEGGRPVQTETEARIFLKRKLNEAGCGLFIAPQQRNLPVKELWPLFVADYKSKDRHLPEAESRWRLHLEPFFGNRKIEHVGYASVAAYQTKRLEQEANPASINREVATLRRMFTLARKAGKTKDIPVFPDRLKEGFARKGFIEQAQFEKVLSGAKELWLRALLMTLFYCGDRRSELIPTRRRPDGGLRVWQVELENGLIRLTEETKNGKPRLLPITFDMKPLLAACVFGKGPNERVFTSPGQDGKHLPVQEDAFRTAWNQLTRKLGLGSFVEYAGKQGTFKKWKPSLLIHDFRRSAVRNLIRAGVSQKVAMDISGHRTASVFDRYNITSEADIVEAGRRINPAANPPKIGTNLVQVDFSSAGKYAN